MLHKSLIDIAQQLTSIMVVELSSLRDAERHPSRGTDDNEDFMKDQKQKLDNLDRVRREVESIAAGYPGAPRSTLPIDIFRQDASSYRTLSGGGAGLAGGAGLGGGSGSSFHGGGTTKVGHIGTGMGDSDE